MTLTFAGASEITFTSEDTVAGDHESKGDYIGTELRMDCKMRPV